MKAFEDLNNQFSKMGQEFKKKGLVDFEGWEVDQIGNNFSIIYIINLN